MPKVRADVVRRLREAKGWSQQALADKAIASLKTVNSVENGNPCLLSTIAKVAKALGVEPAELIDRDDPPSPAGPTPGASPPPPTPAARPGPAVTVRDASVDICFNLRLDFSSLDETGGQFDQILALIRSVGGVTRPIEVKEVRPGSVNLTLAVDPADVPGITKAFLEGKLAAIGATRMTLALDLALSFYAGPLVAVFLNPVAMVVRTFAAAPLAAARLREAGVDVAFAPDLRLVLRQAGDGSATLAETAVSVDAASIRRAVALATPATGLPTFPFTATLRIGPGKAGGPTAAELGARLEVALFARTGPAVETRRTGAGEEWSGRLSVVVASADHLRAVVEAVLTTFLGDAVEVTVERETTSSQPGHTFKTVTSGTIVLSENVLESVRRAVADLLSRR